MSKTKLIFYNPSFENGGVENNIKNLIFLLKKNKNFKIKLITATPEIKIFNQKFKTGFPKFLESLCLNRMIRYFFCSLTLFFYCLTDKYTILSFQNNIISIIVAKITFTKIIVRLNTSPQKYISNIFKKKIFSFFYNLANIIICNSLNFKKDIKKTFGISATVLNNFINYGYIKKKKNDNIDIKLIKKPCIKILNIGRLTNQKNQILLLKALRKVKFNFYLIILGSGELLQNLKNFSKKNKLLHKVKFIKFSKNPYKFLNWCDLFVLTSKYEGMPNVLIEAGYLGKNIISSNCPTGPKELIKHKFNGLLFKNDSEQALINEFNYYKKNQKKKFGLRLKKEIKKKFNNNENLKKLISIVQKL